MVPANVWPLGPTWINHVKSVYTHPFLLFIGQGSIIASSNSKRTGLTGQQRLQRGTSAWNNLNVCEQPVDSAGVMWMIRQLVYLSTRALEDRSPHGSSDPSWPQTQHHPFYVTHPYHTLKNGCLTDTENDCRKREERRVKVGRSKWGDLGWGRRKVKLQENSL